MFDWNDEELNNIIWGETGESDDHIVPFEEGSEDYHNKKEWSQEDTTNKLTEKRTSSGDKHHSWKVDGNNPSFKRDEGNSTSGFTLGSWSEQLSSSKNDNNLGEGADLGKGPENVQNSLDEEDYSWANIGSFDDLDRILSNDDPIFGSVSLDTADELWSSSKDVTNSTAKPFPITGESANLDESQYSDSKTEYNQSDDHSNIPNYANVNPPGQVEYRGSKSKPSPKEKTDLIAGGKATSSNSRLRAEKASAPYHLTQKAGSQKKLSKGRKKTEQKAEKRTVHGFYSVWNTYGQSDQNHLSPNRVQCGSPSFFNYQQIPSQFMAYGNPSNTYAMMPVNPMLSGYEPSPPSNNYPMKKSLDNSTPAKVLTPREKIEKLRRRQQMQALLAIQKQQQRLGHQDPSISQKESQIQHDEGSSHGDLNTSPPSPLEQDDSNIIVPSDNNDSAEETVLYRLQNTISKLDGGVRVCIRDSLFRLAQSAMQRHYVNGGEKESDGGDRYATIPDSETDTNPIDRIVAHLLFRRLMDSPGKNPATPESAASVKIPMERKKENPRVDTAEKASILGNGDDGG